MSPTPEPPRAPQTSVPEQRQGSPLRGKDAAQSGRHRFGPEFLPLNISAPFIRRPVATTLLTIAIALSGLVAFGLLPVAPLPEVDFPVVVVRARMPGASPETHGRHRGHTFGAGPGAHCRGHGNDLLQQPGLQQRDPAI